MTTQIRYACILKAYCLAGFIIRAPVHIHQYATLICILRPGPCGSQQLLCESQNRHCRVVFAVRCGGRENVRLAPLGMGGELSASSLRAAQTRSHTLESLTWSNLEMPM